ncbi:MAG: hypothetical protein CVT49_03280 [candidate division Zixibacteria bacterium HGW-Zixibacteria-1]|nr:MAG: hypothetical protein CVT49_03280 [candidate division Zixibacteria bacterium HGW-Zixibacteria-1]
MKKQQRKPALLIIDDSVGTRYQLKNSFINEFDVSEAANWTEAKPHLEKRKYKFVLIDQILQDSFTKDGLNGIAIAKKINKDYDTTIIIYTLKPSKASHDKAFEAGAKRYIVQDHKDIPKLVLELNKSLPHFFELKEILVSKRPETVLNVLPRYFNNLGCGVSIIDKAYGIWYRNDEHRKMLEGIDYVNKTGGKLREGVSCWVEYLCKYDQSGPCDNCPAVTVFANGVSYRCPVPMKVESSGRVRYFDITSSPIKKGRQVIGAINTVIDVTEREKLIEMGSRLVTEKIIDNRINVLLDAIRTLGYDRIRYYLISADRSEAGMEMVLQKTKGHRQFDKPKDGLRFRVKGDPYWEHTLKYFRNYNAFIYGLPLKKWTHS